MKKIPLTQGQFALVDDADYERVSQFRWYAAEANKSQTNKFQSWYARRNLPTISGKRTTESLHRFLTGLRVDHVDRDGLNNQRKNLRAATRSQNNANRRKFKQSLSRFKGVTWHKVLQKWRARVGLNRGEISLGCFDNERDAARAYDRAARKYFGKFASPNFP